jgi:HEAT repeat protein
MELLRGLGNISPALAAVIISTLVMFAVAISFLVAAWRLRRANRRKAAVWARLEAQLGVTVERIAAGTADPGELQSRRWSSNAAILLDYLYKALIQERRPERQALYRELARPHLGLLEERAWSGDAWQRARAVRTLAELAGRDAAPTIVTALDDAAPHVAGTAARVYAQLRLGPVDQLLARIERYRHWDRRLLRAVLVTFGPAAVPPLAALLGDRSASSHVRAVCAEALAELDGGPAAAAADVEAILRTETDVDLLAACLRLLRAPVSRQVVEVVRGLCDSPDDVIRGQAVGCLARVGEEQDLALLERSLGDGSPWVVRSASLGLAFRGAPAGTEGA